MITDHDYKRYPELTNAEIEEIGFSSPHVQIVDDFFATVVKVHDGDTVTLRVNFRDFDFPLRFAGVDADELSEGGEVARDWLIGKIEGKDVIVGIDYDNRVGKYGRLIGSIILNGINVAQEMLYLGLLKPFGAKKEGQPPTTSRMFDLKQWV